MSLYSTQKKPIKEIKISSNLSVGLFDDGRIMTMIRGVPFVQCRGAVIQGKSEDAIAERMREYKNMDEFLAGRSSAEKKLDIEVSNRHAQLVEPEEELLVHASNIQAWYDNDYNLDIIDSRIAFPILENLIDFEEKARDAFYYEVERRWKEGNDTSRKALLLSKKAIEYVDKIIARENKGDKILSLPKADQVRLARVKIIDKKTIVALSKSVWEDVRRVIAGRSDLDHDTSLRLARDKSIDVKMQMASHVNYIDVIKYLIDEKNIDITALLFSVKKARPLVLSALKNYDLAWKKKMFDALINEEDASNIQKSLLLLLASDLHRKIDTDSTGALLKFLGRGEEHTPALEEVSNELIEKKITSLVGKNKNHTAMNDLVYDMIVERYPNENATMKKTILHHASFRLDFITKLVESGNVKIKDMTPEEISTMTWRGDEETGKFLSFFIQHLHELWNAADIYGKQHLIETFGNELDYLGVHDVINYTCHRARITAEKARAVTMNNFHAHLSPVLAAKLKAIKLNTRSGELIALTKESLIDEKQGILKLKPFSKTSVLSIDARPKNYAQRHFKIGMIKQGFLYPYSEKSNIIPVGDKNITYSMSGRDIEKFCTSDEPEAWLKGLMQSIVVPPKTFFLIYFPFELHLRFTIAWNETAFKELSNKGVWSLESFVMADIIDNLRNRVGMQPFFNLDVNKLIVQRKKDF